MESTSSQQNEGTSLSAFIDAIAAQEQCFEQSLASQQLWSQQLADEQEARIKAVAEKTMVYATQLKNILVWEKSVASEVKTEELSSERGNKEWEPQLQPPSQEFSMLKSKSTSLLSYPEERRRYSPRDHVNRRYPGNFNSYTHYDDYKDHHKSSQGENICHSGDRRSHACRRNLTGRSWNRERRSPSKPESQRYCQEDSHSRRSRSFRIQSGYYRGRNYRRVSRSPAGDSSPPHGRYIHGRKHRERSGASSLETGRSHRSRDILAEGDSNNHGDYNNERIVELTVSSSRYQRKQSMQGNSGNYVTSETLKRKSSLQHHHPSDFPMPLSDIYHSTKMDTWPTKKVSGEPELTRNTEPGLEEGINARTKFIKTQDTHFKDKIVKEEEIDETGFVDDAFDCKDAKELLNAPADPLPEWGSSSKQSRGVEGNLPANTT